MPTQVEKGEAFAKLHMPGAPFIIPNPWDTGSAILCAHAGFKALATTSSGYANTLGRLDYGITRDEVLAHCRAIVDATDLPVSADLEAGFADDLKGVGETYARAVQAGLAGASIEDWSGDASHPIRDKSDATDRVAAAVDGARGHGVRFTLTARAENYLHGKRDLDDTIARLTAYEAAGADVLYAPGLARLEDIKAVTGALTKPVNVLAGFGSPPPSLADLAAVGVARVSLGSHLSRAAMGATMSALNEMAEHGTFSFIAKSPAYPDLAKLFASGPPDTGPRK